MRISEVMGGTIFHIKSYQIIHFSSRIFHERNQKIGYSYLWKAQFLGSMCRMCNPPVLVVMDCDDPQFWVVSNPENDT